jgi:hypothetical protein
MQGSVVQWLKHLIYIYGPGGAWVQIPVQSLFLHVPKTCKNYITCDFSNYKFALPKFILKKWYIEILSKTFSKSVSEGIT